VSAKTKCAVYAAGFFRYETQRTLCMSISGFLLTNLSVWNGLCSLKLLSFYHLNRYYLYTLLCFRTLFSVQLVALAETYSFAIFGLCGGLSELQMCMALCCWLNFEFYQFTFNQTYGVVRVIYINICNSQTFTLF